MKLTFCFSPSCLAFVLLSTLPLWSQFTSLDRERADGILQGVSTDIRKDYYDPKLHGLDWAAKVVATKAAIAKANTWDAAMVEIAALVNDLNDSHTIFIPARTPIRVDYGWSFQMIGDHCYITRVKQGSDAQAKGLKVGDEVVILDGFRPTRETLPKISYAIDVLSPQTALHAAIRPPIGSTRSVEVAAKVTQPKIVNELEHPSGIDWQYFRLGQENHAHQMRPRFVEVGSDVLILKLPEFYLRESDVNDITNKAKKHSALIVDLRDNPGGAVETLQYLLGSVLDKETKIGDEVMRNKTDTLKTKNDHHNVFTGKLIVLIDSNSSSAAEIFARTIQLEKRGTVIGDRSSGFVMEAQLHPRYEGIPPAVYATEVTRADLIMSDGKSLEHVGVTPDEIVLPTQSDVAENRDPVLSRAAELAGVKLTPEDAGKLFPYEWLPD